MRYFVKIVWSNYYLWKIVAYCFGAPVVYCIYFFFALKAGLKEFYYSFREYIPEDGILGIDNKEQWKDERVKKIRKYCK